MHAQIYDFAIGAGQSVAIEAVGEYVKVLSCSGQVRIELDTGPRIDALGGQGVRKEPFNRVLVTDKSGAANVGKILIAYGEMIDDRITGEVSVIDSQRVFTANSQAAFGSKSYAAAAGNYPNVQLWNPAGSGVNLFVEEISFTAGASPDAYLIGFANTSLSTMGGAQQAKRSAGVAVKGEVRFQDSIALATFNAAAGYTYTVDSVGSKVFGLKTPLMVSPGNGLVVTGKTLAAAMGIGFQWIELPL